MVYTAEVSIGLRKNQQEALSAALSKFTTPIDTPMSLEQVVIKPSIYDPTQVGNTHVEVVKAVIRSFGNLGQIVVVESDNPVRNAHSAFERSDYLTLSDSKTSFVNLSNSPMSSVQMPGFFFKEHEMPALLLKRNFLINVPTVKIQPEICSMAAGIKNLFGLVPEVGKDIYHPRIHDVLLDILSVFRPNLTIVDLTSLTIGDRANGNTRHVGAIIVGKDPVAVDAFCSDLVGIDPLKVDYLKRAHALGLGEIVLDHIRVSGTESQKERLFELCRV